MNIAFIDGPFKAFALTEGHAGKAPFAYPSESYVRRSACTALQTALAECLCSHGQASL